MQQRQFQAVFWLDGTDGQEDELDDLRRGKLQPDTDDEDDGGEVIRPRHEVPQQDFRA